MILPKNKVALSLHFAHMWESYVPYAIEELATLHGIRHIVATDEQFRVLADGSGELFMQINGREVHKMVVPVGSWQMI